MSLQAGQRIGAYEVVSAIGAGGMGEVYRARDTKLHRDVALKILPEIFAFDADRLARFEREAQVLASLNHPNIAAIYGFEESDGVRALALELVEGPTLADRIAEGPIPVEEALQIARQIVEALEAAHEAGVVHRDLKPANIKLRPDGTVKVLDFGLAKLSQAGGSAVQTPGLTASPTITTPAVTGIGVILGTAAYMAPEQARGKVVDKRADIWAFGCVLYEMLTGGRTFDGDDVTVVTASIIKSDPNWTALPPETPPAVRTILRGCLQKEPRHRIRDIGDVRLALDGAFVVSDGGGKAAGVALPQSGFGRQALPWVAAVVAASAITGFATWAVSRNPSDAQPASATRFTIGLPEGEVLPTAAGTLVAISPDGRTLIYRSNQNGVFRLYRRAMDQLEATPIGDENAGEAPFFSPDGQWLAFSVGTTLKKVSILGGPSLTLATLPSPTIRGGAWGEDDTMILGGGAAGSGGLLRVRATGGTPEPLVMPDAARLLWYPQILPGGRAVLFTSSEARPDAGELQIVVLETGERRTLLAGSAGRVLPSGHLVFLRGGTLWAAAFNLETLAVAGNPMPLVEGIRVEPGGAVQFAVADAGTLAYLPGGTSASRRLFWIDRQGREAAIDAPPRRYYHPRLSPEGDRIALDVRDQEADVWVWQLTRNTLTRLTFDPAFDFTPTWTPDGKQVIFVSEREKTVAAAFRQAADGTGTTERLGTTDKRRLTGTVLSPDGTRLLLQAVSPDSGEDILVMSLNGDRRIEPLLSTRFTERNAELSPNNRWIAYQSNESGSYEIYVRPFPGVSDGRWQVSTDGGTRPAWNRNGRELLYVTLTGTLMSVPVETGNAFSSGSAARVVDLSAAAQDLGRFYDVSPDGRRFLIAREDAQPADAQIHIVRNWLEELRRLVPVRP
ncbi:MAG TPA: protein kinase [Vicinamibacterales bacterium]